MPKKMTLEALARLTQGEFRTQNATPKAIVGVLETITADVQELKRSLPAIQRGQTALKGDMRDVERRAVHLKRQVGLAR